jgi:hypothetical protein
MKKGVILFLSCTLIFSYVLLGFQKQDKLPQPEEHEVTVRLVLTDVIVTDKKGRKSISNSTH